MSLHGSGLRFNVDVTGFSEVKVHSIPTLRIESQRRIHCFTPRCSKKFDVVLACSSGRGNKIQFFPNGYQPALQSGRSTPFGRNLQFTSSIPCQVKRDSTGESQTGENIIKVEQNLRKSLQLAIEQENYAQAAEIRDSLKTLHENNQASVLAANSRFYDSFRRGDLASMQNLWSKSDEACCVHPGSSGITGYDFIMESWDVVWMNYEFPLEIELKDILVHVRGDLGYVTCIEYVKTKGSSWGGQFVTNVFEKIDGKWFICIHHASPIDL